MDKITRMLTGIARPTAENDWPQGGRARTIRRPKMDVFILLVLLNLMLTQTVECDSSIIMTQFQVPPLVAAGELVRLSCNYKLSGETLHALKLFKDNEEFYRFTPAHATGQQGQLAEDQRLIFPIPGVTVDKDKSSERNVWLKNVNKRTAGLYRCQVSVENTFKSASAEKKMVVVDSRGSRSQQQLQQRHAVQQRQRQQQQQGQQQFRGDQVASMPVSIQQQLESSQSSASSSSAAATTMITQQYDLKLSTNSAITLLLVYISSLISLVGQIYYSQIRQ